MQATAGPFPQADAASTQPQGCPGKHCVASTHERSMQEVKMGGFGAKRPFWGHFCTGSANLAPYCTLYRNLPSRLLSTVSKIRYYAVFLKNTVCTLLIVPYHLTVLAQQWYTYRHAQTHTHTHLQRPDTQILPLEACTLQLWKEHSVAIHLARSHSDSAHFHPLVWPGWCMI